MSRIGRRVGVIQAALREEDVERLYRDDGPTVEVVERVSSSEIPAGTDRVLRAPLSAVDVDFGEVDVLEQDLVRVFLLVGRLTGSEVRPAVVPEVVDEVIARAETQRADVGNGVAEIEELSAGGGVRPERSTDCD